MWTAIKYVGSGLTLVAFLCALAAWLYKSRLLERERLIKSVPEEKRAELVERTLVLFKVDPSHLTREHQYDLALTQIREHARRFQVTAVVIVIIAIIIGALTLVSMLKSSPPPVPSPSPTPTPAPASKSLTGKIERVEIVPGQGGNVQVLINLAIMNAGAPTSVYQYNIHISHVSLPSIEFDGPPEEIKGAFTVPQAGGKRITIQPQDSIVSKTIQAIRSGQRVEGWLYLTLPLPEDVLRQPGIKYTVSFVDATGNTHQATYEVQ